MSAKRRWRNGGLWALALVAVVALSWMAWTQWQEERLTEGFLSSNGRIEATEVDIATRHGGRLTEVWVREGDFVESGQLLARLDTQVLQAQFDEAQAGHQQALQAVAAAQAQVALRRSDAAAVRAMVVQREVELDAAQRRLTRTETLAARGAAPQQERDDDRARVRSAEAALQASRAQVMAADAAIDAALAQVAGAESAVRAASATLARIRADLAEADLVAPRAGRVQFRLAHPGEVVPPGGRVLNLIDVTDVYMTFFLPEQVAGRMALGSEVRLVLDAAPEYVIPARLTFVSASAQFTPRTVETESERQKLMFRVRASIDPDLLRQHLDQVKTGLPGVAWVRVDTQRDWPESLRIRLPE